MMSLSSDNRTFSPQRSSTSLRVHPISVLGPGLLYTYLVLGLRPILVDAGMPGKSAQILSAIAKQGVNPKDLALIFLTHGHIDHFGSAQELRKETGAPIAIHTRDVEALRRGRSSVSQPVGFFGRVFNRTPLPHATVPGFEPDIIFTEEQSLDAFGLQGRIIETPGHTPGSISIFLANGELLAGDLLAGGLGQGLLPFRQHHPAHPPFQENFEQVRQSIEKIVQLAPTKIYVGHGGPLSLQDVQQFLREERHFAR